MSVSRFLGNDKPLLQKWGKIITQRIFARYSCIDAYVKRSLVNLVDTIQCNETPEIYIIQQFVHEILCYLPYVLGLACETGYLHRIQVDVSKPILFVSNTNHDLTCLMEALSSKPVAGTLSYLLSKRILTKVDIANGAQYRTSVVESSDINSTHSGGKSDIVLCTRDCLPHLPHRGFSLVIAQEEWHSALSGYQIHSCVLILKYCPNPCSSQQPEKDKNVSGPTLVHYADMIAKEEWPVPVLLKPQIKGIQELINRITDFNCNHIPIKMNISRQRGLKELISALPYILGSTVIRNSSCLDLSKPILFLTTDIGAYQTASDTLKAMPRGHGNKDLSEDGRYRCCLLNNEFEVCTYDQQINDVEVILSCTASMCSKSENVLVMNDFYKDFHSNNFSAVVIVQSKYLPIKMETEVLMQFSGLTAIFIRANVKAENTLEDGNIWVVPKAATIQYYGAELIIPALMIHGNDITERYLLSQKSILTDCQQVGLANILDWFGNSESNHNAAYVTTAIGCKYAGMMVWCLPSMLEWGDNNYLIPDGSVNLRKPLLVLCAEKQSLNNLWDLVHSSNAFHQSSLFRSAKKCSDGMHRSFLVADTKSAIGTRYLTGEYKMVFSDMQHLDYLPDDGFSVTILFESHMIPAEWEDAVMKKFRSHSKIIFLTSNRIGPLKQFELHSGYDILIERERQGKSTKIVKVADVTPESTEAPAVESHELSQIDNSKHYRIAETSPAVCNESLSMVDSETEQQVPVTPIAACDHIPIKPLSVSSDSSNGSSSDENSTMNSTASPERELAGNHIVELKEDITKPIPQPATCALVKTRCRRKRITMKDTPNVITLPNNSSGDGVSSHEDANATVMTACTEEINAAMGLTTSQSEDTQAPTSSVISPRRNKASLWFRKRKKLSKTGNNQCKAKRQVNILQQVPNQVESASAEWGYEYTANERQKTGMLSCFKFKKSNKKYTTTSSTKKSEAFLEENNVGDSDINVIEPSTWSEPVIYLASHNSGVSRSSPVDTVIKVEQIEDAISLESIAWSEPSSIDVVSLTDRNNPGSVQITSVSAGIQESGELDAGCNTEEVEPHYEFNEMPNVITPVGSQANAWITDLVTTPENSGRGNLTLKSFRKSLKKSILFQCFIRHRNRSDLDH